MKLLPSKKNLRKKNLVKKPDFANLKTQLQIKRLWTLYLRQETLFQQKITKKATVSTMYHYLKIEIALNYSPWCPGF